MKKNIIKIIVFAAIFSVVWMGADYVLSRDWEIARNQPLKYQALESEKQLDVLYFGGSNTYKAIAPVVIWNEANITGYNLGYDGAHPMLFYYQLKYALKKQKPSLAVIDVSAIANPREPKGDTELPFRLLYVSMPDHEIREEFLKDMCERWNDVNPLEYHFPLMRYHERWSDLDQEDFDPDAKVFKYRSFLKGCTVGTDIRTYSFDDNFFRDDYEKAEEMHLEYLEKIYDLCTAEGINMMLLYNPRTYYFSAVEEAAEKFAQEHGIKLLSMASRERLDEAGILAEEDFYDGNHVNILGQKKFSEYLADFLKDNYVFVDHEKDDALCKEWNKEYEDYMKYYTKRIKSMKK